MKTITGIVLAAIFATTIAAVPAKAKDWYVPQEPFVIYRNTYYVGTGSVSAVLITSPAGHILIDVGAPKAAAQVAAHIRKLGFKVEDIRFILNSHEHPDHAGAIAEMQKMSHATVLASPASLQVLSSGQPDKGDAQYPDLEQMMPVAKSRAVKDGEVVRIGPLAVTAHFTPGHTKGATSWTWQSTENGKSVDMVFGDSLNAMAAKGLRFSGNPLYPNAKADIERSIATVASLKCDVLVTAHPEASGLWERKAKQPTLGDAAFIDKQACRDYAAQASATLARTLAAEAAAAKTGTNAQ